jgi:hypothetical protein
MRPGKFRALSRQGRVKIARRFNAGVLRQEWSCVPEERSKRDALMALFNRAYGERFKKRDPDPPVELAGHFH